MSQNNDTTKFMQQFVGKTIKAVRDTDLSQHPNLGYQDEGFVIEFTDGTFAVVEADCGQNVGYVVVQDIERA